MPGQILSYSLCPKMYRKHDIHTIKIYIYILCLVFNLQIAVSSKVVLKAIQTTFILAGNSTVLYSTIFVTECFLRIKCFLV